MDTSSLGSRGSNRSTAAAYLALVVLSVPHLRYDRFKCFTRKVINALFIYLDGELRHIPALRRLPGARGICVMYCIIILLEKIPRH